MMLAAYLVFCPAYNPENCDWVIKGGHFINHAGVTSLSSYQECGRVLVEGETPYGEGKVVIKCFPEGTDWPEFTNKGTKQ